MDNSFASVHPELIAEWSERNLPITPDEIKFGSNKDAEGNEQRRDVFHPITSEARRAMEAAVLAAYEAKVAADAAATAEATVEA